MLLLHTRASVALSGAQCRMRGSTHAAAGGQWASRAAALADLAGQVLLTYWLDVRIKRTVG
jgi:hypothetical protein